MSRQEGIASVVTNADMVDGYHGIDLNPSYETLCKVWLPVANQAIPSGVRTRVMMSFREIDIGEDYDQVLCEYITPSPGFYLARMKLQMINLNAGNFLECYIEISGFSRARGLHYCPANGFEMDVQCTLLQQCALGEPITFHVAHNFGANRDVQWGVEYTSAIIRKLRD